MGYLKLEKLKMKKILIINIEKNIRMLILERERVSKINIESTMVYNPNLFSIFFFYCNTKLWTWPKEVHREYH